MKKLLVFSLISIFPIFAFGGNKKLESFLNTIEGLTYKEVKVHEGFECEYELRIEQPLDHENPEKGSFTQKFWITHYNFEAPVVIQTRGYPSFGGGYLEITDYVDGNHIKLEQRYLGESAPDSMNYQHLTLKQIANDAHRINQIFRKLYSGKWISAGGSKGGMLATYYRYYYPNDVDVTFTIVAPVMNELEDPRIYTFFDTIGTQECRQKIFDFQIRLLENRKEVLSYLKWYALGAKLEFTYLSLEEAFEYAILEYPFAFWQTLSKCEEIPNVETSIEEAVKYLVKGRYSFDFFSDKFRLKTTANNYLAISEIGYYGYKTGPYKDLLKALPTDRDAPAYFPPKNVTVEYDRTTNDSVNEWLRTDGNNFIRLYGSLDPWSSCAYFPSENTNSITLMLPGKHHKQVRIKYLSGEDRNRLKTTIEKWLDITLTDPKWEE